MDFRTTLLYVYSVLQIVEQYAQVDFSAAQLFSPSMFYNMPNLGQAMFLSQVDFSAAAQQRSVQATASVRCPSGKIACVFCVCVQCFSQVDVSATAQERSGRVQCSNQRVLGVCLERLPKETSRV